MNDDNSIKVSKKWVKVRIPEHSKGYNYLFVQMKDNPLAKWKLIETIITEIDEMKDTKLLLAEKVFELFVAQMMKIYPHKEKEFKMLRSLILWQIIQEDTLSEGYYKKLTRLGLDK